MVRTSSSTDRNLLQLVSKHWPMIVIVVLATWLRVWHLDTHGIWFGDAAHDILEAQAAVEQGHLPRLGIASSVPQFKQGPVTVWLEMGLYLVFGSQLVGYFLVFALLNLLALIGLYELCRHHLSLQAAWVASFIFAFSPLAIAHARMPYHITPIPLMTVIFLWALTELWHRKPTSWFTAGLCFSLLFQFELAVVPLIALIPYVIWRTKQRLTWQNLSLLLGGLTIGLLPQIVYDLTHDFQQLGGFALWVGRWLGSFLVGVQAPSVNKLATYSQAWLTFGTRIFAVHKWLGQILLGLSAISLLGLSSQAKQRKLFPLVEITLVSFYLLAFAYFVHGSPSEAYFPPFIIFFALVMGAAYHSFFVHHSRGRYIVIAALLSWGFFNAHSIFRINFFVSTDHPFNYGPSIYEQQQVLSLIATHTDQPFTLKTTSEAGIFPNYFDNFRLLARERGLVERTDTFNIYYIEQPGSGLQNYPNATYYQFPSLELYQLL